MKTTYVVLLHVLILFLYPVIVTGQTDSWKDIKVMRSTRNDVRRILKEQGDGSIFEIYSVKDGTIDISYTYGKCTDEANSGWDLPEGTVLEFAFTPLNDIKFSTLKLDLRKFEKVIESPHVPEIVTYIDRENGVRYVVQESGLLSTIGFFPSRKNDKARCLK
jgi:hypothetical protein